MAVWGMERMERGGRLGGDKIVGGCHEEEGGGENVARLQALGGSGAGAGPDGLPAGNGSLNP